MSPAANLSQRQIGRSTVAYRAIESRVRFAPPTILMGGAFANVFSFQLVERALAGIGPVVLLDMPGAGFAGAAPPGYTQDDALTVFSEMVDFVSADQVNIVGICNGGPIAHAYAAHNAERVSALILGSTVLRPSPTTVPKLSDISASLEAGDAAGMATLVLDMLMGLETHGNVVRGAATRSLLGRALAETSGADMIRMASALRLSLATWEGQPSRVGGVRALGYTGAHDPYTTVEDCRTAARSVDGIEFYAFEQCDHMVHIERPREMADMFVRFLAGENLAGVEHLRAVP